MAEKFDLWIEKNKDIETYLDLVPEGWTLRGSSRYQKNIWGNKIRDLLNSTIDYIYFAKSQNDISRD